jgi:hypothetical protein
LALGKEGDVFAGNAVFEIASVNKNPTMQYLRKRTTLDGGTIGKEVNTESSWRMVESLRRVSWIFRYALP